MLEELSGEPSTAERLARWRAYMSLALARGLAVLTLPGLIWFVVDALRFHLLPAVWAVGLFGASNTICALARVPTRVRAFWLIGNLASISWFFMPLTGLPAGQGAAVLLIAVLGVLLLGPREGAAALLIVGLGISVRAVLTLLGVVARPHADLSDAGDPLLMLRATLVSLTFGAVAVIALSYQFRQLFRTLEKSQELVRSQRAEMAAREEEARRRRQAEDGLVRAQKLETIGRLAGSVAHDVNNNLTVVLTAIELLERTQGLEATGKGFATSAREACENASLLLRQLLALGRRDLVQPELVNIHGAFARIERLLHTLLGPRMRLEVSVASDLPPVHVDARQLEQVILNLAINARDAMPEGGTLTLSAELGRSTPDYQLVGGGNGLERAVCVHVTDTGTGIDEANLTRLGEPFFTTKGEKGTGLGLAAVRAFAEASGGRLGVRTQRNQGSTFTLELPAARAAREAEPRVIHPGSVRILVVDDDERVRTNMVAVLSDAGYEVLEAEHGIAALLCAQGRTIDLLCSDALMPRLGGHEFIARFTDAHPESRVLLCSAFVQEQSLRELVHEGHYTALPKPFGPAELRRAVAQALTSRPRAPETSGASLGL